MTGAQSMLLVTVAAPWVAAVSIFALGERREGARTVVGLAAGVVATFGAIVMGLGVASGTEPVSVGVPLLGFGLGLRADGLGTLFAVVASALWLLTTVYATGYMAHAKDRARFFGFFAICVASAMGIAFSANLLTLFVFYEALTLATYPLVIHSGTPAAIKGGRTYLLYALSGGTLLALGVIWLYALGGGGDFASGGVLPDAVVAAYGPQLVAVFALLVAGFGVKAALFPAHGWLPAAMVAPAPVSALLHAVAVVKAGVFGLARVVLDVYGVDTATSLGLLVPLSALAAFTLLFASIRALAQDDIKKRLAYSTIGQLSYIVLGIALGTPVAAAAAIAHLAHHAVLKITMFFTAGVLAEELKVHRVSRMDGIGRRMPVTMTAFSVAALGIIGIPPMAGFVSKWGLGIGGLGGGEIWPLVVLSVSSVLNAVYLLPMIGRAWFAPPHPEWSARDDSDSAGRGPEADRRMVWPLAITSLAGLVFGVAAAAPWAPASWAAAVTGARVDLVVPWRPDLVGLDESGAFFLALAVVVWVAAAVSSWREPRPNRMRYRVFFALSASGSVALAFARDPALFYAAFSVMALSAYGLIIHEGSDGATRAGRAYLAFTVVAEALLLAGLMLGSNGSGSFVHELMASPWVGLGIFVLLIAFGIKIGAIGLSGWMPGAYAAAPAGAGAAIAGVASTAGILGLLRFLPGGVADLAGWGAAVMIAGLAAAFFGAAAGCVQREPHHVLAYSSVSQFGLMTVGIGAGLATAEVWPAAVAAVGIYLLHHGFAKAALFAGEDVARLLGRSRLLAAGLVLPALALAGAPFTSGGIAKVALKGVAAGAPAFWAHILDVALPLAAVGTTLLMARLLVLSMSRARSRSTGPVRGRIAAFAVLLLAVAAPLWIVGVEHVEYAAHKSLTAQYMWALSWPILLGGGVATAVWRLRDRIPSGAVGFIPPGDLWARALRVADSRWLSYGRRLAGESAPRPESVRAARVSARSMKLLEGASQVESRALSWVVASAAFALLALVFLVMAR